MATIGLIGAGHIGSQVARLALASGYDVVISNSRGPETLSALVAELGPRARAGTPVDAATAGDIVVVTVPLKNVDQVPAEPLAGKIVIDTCNYYPQRDGQIDALDDGSTTSSELLQAHLPQSHVVKGFNNIYFEHLRDLAQPLLPAGADGRSTLAIAGDDAAAKDAVRRAFDAIGYDTLDLGPLAEGWRTQPGQPAYGLQYAKDEADWTAGARPVSSDELAGRAMRATREA